MPLTNPHTVFFLSALEAHWHKEIFLYCTILRKGTRPNESKHKVGPLLLRAGGAKETRAGGCPSLDFGSMYQKQNHFFQQALYPLEPPQIFGFSTGSVSSLWHRFKNWCSPLSHYQCVTCNVSYAKMALKMKVGKVTEICYFWIFLSKIRVFRFFFFNFVKEKSRNRCVIVHFSPLPKFHLHRQLCTLKHYRLVMTSNNQLQEPVLSLTYTRYR